MLQHGPTIVTNPIKASHILEQHTIANVNATFPTLKSIQTALNQAKHSKGTAAIISNWECFFISH
jgi:dihydroxyacetone kinase